MDLVYAFWVNLQFFQLLLAVANVALDFVKFVLRDPLFGFFNLQLFVHFFQLLLERHSLNFELNDLLALVLALSLELFEKLLPFIFLVDRRQSYLVIGLFQLLQLALVLVRFLLDLRHLDLLVLACLFFLLVGGL